MNPDQVANSRLEKLSDNSFLAPSQVLDKDISPPSLFYLNSLTRCKSSRGVFGSTGIGQTLRGLSRRGNGVHKVSEVCSGTQRSEAGYGWVGRETQ